MSAPQRLVISNFTTGFETDRDPFLLNNDAFPVLENAYIWRGRVQKKRGTYKLGRLALQVVGEVVGIQPGGTTYFSGNLANLELDPGRIQLYAQAAITIVTPGATTLITAPGHQFTVGQTVVISGVTGTGTITDANGSFVIIGPVIAGVSFTIGVATAGVYTGGGLAKVFGQQTRTIIAPGIDNTNPATVHFTPLTTALPNGTTLQISGVNGLIDPVTNLSIVNSIFFTIAGSLAAQFDLVGLDATAASPWISGGLWTLFHNYVTGFVQTIFEPTFSGPQTILADYSYFPDLPVMGIESFENYNTDSVTANTIFLDTRKSYQFSLPIGTRFFYDVSFYKVTNLPITWNGTDAQQFWSTNFENAVFVTQNVPGLNGVRIASITNVVNPVITTVDPHLIPVAGENDWIFIAGVSGLFSATSTPPNVSWVNGLSLQINVPTTVFVPALGATAIITAVVTGPNTIQLLGLAVVAATPGANGFLQVLTKQYGPAAPYGINDGIHWYDGDPTQTPLARFGWVNFAPPLNATDPTNALDFVRFMVGARLLTSFAGAMMALGVWEISTDPAIFTNGPVYNPQRIRWCTIAGTPFYSNPLPTVILAGGAATTEITYDPNAWVENINGRGGYFDLITHEEIISVTDQQESLIIGMEGSQRRLTATGSVINPFVPYVINPEYGTIATFSTVPLDKGALSIGQYGFIVTTTFNAERFDLKIPDQVFQFLQYVNNVPQGSDRVCSIRNWQEETIHFTYVDAQNGMTYPNRTVYFNYRDPSFAIFRESYTTYGYFRDSLPLTWATLPYLSWNAWLPNWYAYDELPGYPDSTGGNQEGYIMIKDFESTTNDFSLKILTIVAGSNPLINTNLGVPKHNLQAGDYIFVDRAAGINSFNKRIALVTEVIDANTLEVDIPFAGLSGVYSGGGEIIVLDNFFFQTKEFAQMWGNAKGLRLGTQRFLLDKTDTGEFSVALYVSQDRNLPANIREPDDEPWVPSANIVRTRPDVSLGIRGAANNQQQIWHRNSVSVLGDGVQMGGFLSDAQMRATVQNSAGEPFPSIAMDDWVLSAMVIDLYGSRTLI